MSRATLFYFRSFIDSSLPARCLMNELRVHARVGRDLIKYEASLIEKNSKAWIAREKRTI